jgi:hypothetical protein
MRMADPLAVAKAAQDALDPFGEVTICAEFGDGCSCTQRAGPDGSPRCVGRDDRGCEVWMRRRRCIAAIGTTSKPWHPTRTSDATMIRIRIEQSKIRKERQYDPRLLDPHDPDILRARQLMDVFLAQERRR